jgi:16S rRNA (cytidine1402-2'-O)-methyltransferase
LNTASLESVRGSASRGILFLVPNALDFGTVDDSRDLQDSLPLGVIRVAARLSHWVAENAKTTRAFLKRVNAIEPLQLPLQGIAITELPRPPKGHGPAEPPAADLNRLLSPALAGHDIGLLSEAGLPAVADPGAPLVLAAHGHGLRVVTLPGASALVLAVAASGLNGQRFAFEGYLPVEAGTRSARIKEMEATSRRLQQTQVVIETPYRNAALLAALVAQLQPATRLSVSVGLTLPQGETRTDTVAGWRAKPSMLPDGVPAMFSFLAR